MPVTIKNVLLLVCCVFPYPAMAGAEEIMRCTDALYSNSIGLYDTLEITLVHPGISANPFDFGETQVAASFVSPTGSEFHVAGFFDGVTGDHLHQSIWKIRFMPNQEGVWNFRLTGGNTSQPEPCTFRITPAHNPFAHGHVRLDPDHPRFLVHDDGTPHYWYGGKWISAQDYGPKGKMNSATGRYEVNPFRISNKDILHYLDLLEEYRHNGILLKIALFPLENDQLSWDLDWIRRAEWIVREAGERGIYVQINLFDTWSRPADAYFRSSTNGKCQLFNVWEKTNLDKKKNYILTVIARFAGFYNVYWELGNEMEHEPNCGKCFVALADQYYIPWIRKHDPYRLPIALSESLWQDADVDIGFLHQTNVLPPFENGKPVIMNELVRGGLPLTLWEKLLGHEDGLYDDAYMRSAGKRLAYRRTFWNMFVRGGSGSSEATWLDISKPADAAVQNVMADHRRLRDFIDSLSVNINRMLTSPAILNTETGPIHTRMLPGQLYVGYFPEPPEETGADNVEVTIAPGVYRYWWYNPANGKSSEVYEIDSSGDRADISRRSDGLDSVLVIRRMDNRQESPISR
jgi:Domain of unknown function (DUF5060)/Cellulase (glycosyl hydrolase family 5)